MICLNGLCEKNCASIKYCDYMISMITLRNWYKRFDKNVLNRRRVCSVSIKNLNWWMTCTFLTSDSGVINKSLSREFAKTFVFIGDTVILLELGSFSLDKAIGYHKNWSTIQRMFKEEEITHSQRDAKYSFARNGSIPWPGSDSCVLWMWPTRQTYA